MKDLIHKLGVYPLVLLWAIACFCFFQFSYEYHFFYQEQNQLFLGTSDYLCSYLNRPGWLACMMGDFLTQFYYYRYAGAIILTLSLLLLGASVAFGLKATSAKDSDAKASSNKLSWVSWLGAFISMTFVAGCSLHYDYRLSSVYAWIGGATMFCIGSRALLANRRWLSVLSIIVSAFLCHWLFGCGIWLYGALLIISCARSIKQPGTIYRLVALIIPFFLLPLTKRLYLMEYSTIYTYPGIGKLVKPQFELEKTLAADCEYYFGNYNKVVNIVEREEAPNRYQKFYYNMVMAQRDKLPDALLRYPDNNLGTFDTVGPDTPPLTIKTIGELYWLLGDMTFAERATTLANVQSNDKRNIRMVKRLAEINLVTGEYQAARKYLRILRNTFVWRGWASNILSAIDEHANAEEKACLKPYLDKRPFTNTRDTLRLNDNCYTIMRELAESNPANSIAINYMLCSDLLLKDMDTFKHDYDAYYLPRQASSAPLYQQALMIYLAGTNAAPAEWQRYIKGTDLLQSFKQYNEQRGSLAFSNTYWYYFDKAPVPQLNNSTSK